MAFFVFFSAATPAQFISFHENTWLSFINFYVQSLMWSQKIRCMPALTVSLL